MSNADIVRPTATVAAVEDTFLDIDDLMTRYGIGRTKTYDLIKEEGFPTSVVPGMVRIPLVALREYERLASLSDTVERFVGTTSSGPTVVLAPPAPRKPGPKSSKAA
jgi:predicted DNA-binding transcriptional regulator AlpA